MALRWLEFSRFELTLETGSEAETNRMIGAAGSMEPQPVLATSIVGTLPWVPFFFEPHLI